MPLRSTLSPTKSTLLPGDHGPPIRRDARYDDVPIDDDHTDDGSPVFERMAVVQMSGPSFAAIMDYLTAHPPERAAALIGPKDHDAVTHVLIDEAGEGTPASFTLGHVLLNRRLKPYVAVGLDIKGIAHSHPKGCVFPSLGDLRYVGKCFASDIEGGLERFLLPIVCGQRLYPYIIFRNDPTVAHFAQVVLF